MTEQQVNNVQETSETESIISAIAEMNSNIDPESLHDRLHGFFATVFDSELITFGETNNDDQEFGDPGKYKILYEGSDLSLANDLKGSPAGVSYQIGVGLRISEGIVVELTLSRPSRAFSDADKATLDLLVPHVRNAIRSSDEVRRMKDRSMHYESLLSRVSRGYIKIATDGSAVEITERALLTLQRHFKDWNTAAERLPLPVDEWLGSTLANDVRSTVIPPLRLTRPAGELRFSPVYDHSSRNITLLIEERARISPSHLAVAGLTDREIEILQLMEAGKPDSVIAVLLEISNRTVQKHVENVFRKLNAETRTEAVHKATDIVRFVSSDSFRLADLQKLDPEWKDQ